MRRSAWAFIRQADILSSFQMGLPSMVEQFLPECSLPRNIYDEEGFDEDCKELPAALPDSEPTQVSYLIAKTKLAFGFARAVKEIDRAPRLQWEQVLEIDRELRHIYDNIPNHYKLGQLSSQDCRVLVSSRFTLASIHHKSLCIVHSRFLEIAKSDSKYLYSRRICLSSAMSLLRFQAIQNQEISINGRLRSLTDYQTSLAIHDYLLAATIISADLYSNTSIGSSANQKSSHSVPTRVEMIKALSISARIFGKMRDQSMEAYKAADVLEMLVKKFESGDFGTAQSPKESQRPRTGSSFWSKGNDSTSDSVSWHARTLPRAYFTSPRNLPNLSCDSGSAQTDELVPGRLGVTEGTNSDTLSTWLQTQISDFYAQPSTFPMTCPESNVSISRVLPGNMEPSTTIHQPDLLRATVSADETAEQLILEDGISGNDSSGTANTLFYSGGLILNNPMSTLWNMTMGI